MKRLRLIAVALLSGKVPLRAECRARCRSWSLETGRPARGGVSADVSAKPRNSPIGLFPATPQ
eukprot:7014325-Lingulodinium_polyedra.AAC.1